MVNVFFLSLNKDASALRQWDAGFILDLFNSIEANIEEVNAIPKGDKAIVVIPGRHHAGLEKQVNKELGNLNKPILFVMGDEEAEFDISLIDVPKSRIWIQNPHLGKHDDYNRLGTGYPQHMKDNLPVFWQPKNQDLFFAGQVTHQRRVELVYTLQRMKNKGKDVSWIETEGFTKGVDPETYYHELATSRIAPAPSGAVIPDSFRLFEALECMCIPVADQRTADGQVMEYWDWLFNEITPFPKVTDWAVLPGIYEEMLDDFTAKVHKQTAWYLLYKRNLKHKILEQING